MVGHHVTFYYFYAFVIAQLPYNLSYLFTVLPIDSFSPILRGEDNMVLTQPLRMCQILFFRHTKNTFSIVDGSLNNSVLSKRCFFMFNFFGAHPLSGGFFVSVASSLNCLKALKAKDSPDGLSFFHAFVWGIMPKPS